jgi:pimeloyl-ACP methyl ester carboxylesterase
MAEQIPDARIRLVTNAGHAPQLEAPGEFTTVLDEFLDEHLGHGALVDRDA